MAVMTVSNNANYSLGRKCAVCGADITDDNPDGIGCTCREVWRKATNQAFYHFEGLNVWIAKSEYWVNLFLESFKDTKFRSKFRKGFFSTIKKMYDENNIRLSKKMMGIIQNMLIGDLEFPGNSYPKLSGHAIQKAIDNERELISNLKRKWLDKSGPDERQWIINLSKKYYNESRG